MSAVHVCPTKDIECGNIPDLWCAACPKWSALRVPDWKPSQREYFAAMAMQGLSAHAYATGEPSAKVIAAWAVEQADALIAALNKESQS